MGKLIPGGFLGGDESSIFVEFGRVSPTKEKLGWIKTRAKEHLPASVPAGKMAVAKGALMT
jgi:hypothetical protein